ncbi:MAG TPA: DUF2721 domain-containing protein [Candidatus Eremiobacteraceae bacterium]|nr:DUF2721 domain-containing protein [Candidatus Eremiobacteraceae bacterium]
MSSQLGGASLTIVSAMITPAILILAAGSLVNTTLVRLGRAVDRARWLIDRGDEYRAAGNQNAVRVTDQRLERQLKRAELSRLSLSGYYVAIALFLVSSLAIAINELTGDPFPMVGPAIVILGGIVLLLSTAAVVVEVNISAGTLREEARQYRQRELDP